MYAFFKDDDFDFEFESLLGGAAVGTCDLGEALATAARIKNGDFDSWVDEWLATGERTRLIAEECEAKGHVVSARQAHLRASTYLFTATVFMLGSRKAGDVTGVWELHRRAFERAAELTPGWERIAIPYEGTHLDGYLFRADDERRPLVILNNGSDGPVTFMLNQVAGALERGYHALTFDGPGEGEALYRQGLSFRPDWEKVVTPVVDFAAARPEVDAERIALTGISQGGYWVLRAAAFEHRLAAVVADPGVMRVYDAMESHLPHRQITQLEAGEKEKFDSAMHMGARFSKKIRYTMAFRFTPYGFDSPFDVYTAARAYDLAEVIEDIRCPTLVLDPEHEAFWPGQSREAFDALTVERKEIIAFSDAEGASAHCEPLSVPLRNQRVFDWLDEVLAP
jgi:dienelactone hydrolase